MIYLDVDRVGGIMWRGTQWLPQIVRVRIAVFVTFQIQSQAITHQIVAQHSLQHSKDRRSLQIS